MSTATYARRKAEGRCGRCGERAPRAAGTLCQACCDGTRVKAAMERAHERATRRCLFGGCENRHHAHGYCPGHWAQVRQGRPLAPLNPQHDWTPEEIDTVYQRRASGWTWIAIAKSFGAELNAMRMFIRRTRNSPHRLASLPRNAPGPAAEAPCPGDEVPDPDEATGLPEALERCRCGLLLPCNGCLPSAYEVASRRREAA